MHRFEFDEETLKYFLGKIKERIDEKQSREYYLVEVPAGTEGALIVGTHDIDPELIEESGIEINKSVLIKERFMLEIEFTQEEKEAISYFLESDGAESEIDDRLAGFNFDVMDPDEFSVESIKETLDPNTFYIISKNADIKDASHVAFIKDILTSDGLQTFIDTKVNKVEGKTLSEVDFTEDYKEMLDSIDTKKLIMNKDIKDSLESNKTDKVLSANQGNVLRVDYMGDHQFEYVDDCEEIYGLTQKQVNMLSKAYNYTFMDPMQECASLKEVADARLNQENKYHRNLKDRIDEIEARLKHAMMNVDLMEDVIDFYGFQFDFEDQEGQRIGKAKGLKSKDFDSIYPWAGMKRCNLKDGEILCYEGDDTYKEDGSNGDVMVEIPKFYYKVVPVRTEPASSGEGLQLVEAKWMISPVPSKGFKVHPAFIRNNTEIDFIYVSAFEGSAFNMNNNSFIENNAITLSTDKICSARDKVVMNLARVGFNKSNIETLITNNYFEYKAFDFRTLSAIQLLFIIEHASFDSQSCVGEGIISEQSYLKTGHHKAATYRNIENLWGNTWDYIGDCQINMENSKVFMDFDLNNPTRINFSLSDGIGDDCLNRFGYDENNDFVFICSKLGPSNQTAKDGFHGYSYNNNQAKSPHCMLSGGRQVSKDFAGLFASAFDVSLLDTLYSDIVSARFLFYK